MTHVIHALLAALLLVTGTPARAAVLTPIAQQLELELDPLAERWNGSVTTRLRIHQAATRLTLALRGPLPSRIEMRDGRGKVELLWAARTEGLVIETRRPMRPGEATLFISYDADFADHESGLVRTGVGDATHVTVHLGGRGADHVMPLWPDDPAMRWTVLVHAPHEWRAHATALTSVARESQGRWVTTTLRAARPLRASALTLELTPAK